MKRLQTFKRLLELGIQLVEMTQKRVQTARTDTKKVVRDFRDDAAAGAEQLSQDLHKRLQVNKLLHDRPSAGTTALQFMVGLGVGMGAALLFSPLSGRQMREKLLNLTPGWPMIDGIDEEAEGNDSKDEEG